MNGLCKRVIAFQNVGHTPLNSTLYQLDVELVHPIEAGEHVHLELSPVLTLRNVHVEQLDTPTTYRVVIDEDYHEDMNDCRHTLLQAVQAMQLAEKIPLASGLISTITDRIRKVVPAEFEIDVRRAGAKIAITINNELVKVPLRLLYEDWLLAGGLKFMWNPELEELRVNYNYPDANSAMAWVIEHNKELCKQALDYPDIASVVLANRGVPGGQLHYAYMVTLMNGSYTEMPMRITQILNMIRINKQPPIELDFDDEKQESKLMIHMDHVLPPAILEIEHISDEVLAMTADL